MSLHIWKLILQCCKWRIAKNECLLTKWIGIFDNWISSVVNDAKLQSPDSLVAKNFAFSVQSLVFLGLNWFLLCKLTSFVCVCVSYKFLINQELFVGENHLFQQEDSILPMFGRLIPPGLAWAATPPPPLSFAPVFGDYVVLQQAPAQVGTRVATSMIHRSTIPHCSNKSISDGKKPSIHLGEWWHCSAYIFELDESFVIWVWVAHNYQINKHCLCYKQICSDDWLRWVIFGAWNHLTLHREK